ISGGEKAIFDIIYPSYEPRFRPKQNDSDITVVTLRPTNFRILNVDALEQSIQFVLDFSQSWFDYRLMWARDTEATALKTIKVPESSLWAPDINPISSLARRSIIPTNRRVAEISFDGTVSKTDPSIVTMSCAMKVSRYPFDVQTCIINIGPWVYRRDELRLQLDSNNFTMKTEQSTSEWSVKDVGMNITQDNDNLDSLVLTVKLRRNSAYYVYAVVIPTFVNCCLCIFGLFMPTETSGVRFEKCMFPRDCLIVVILQVSLGVTCLLALAMLAGSATNNMPKAETIPFLGIYILATCVLCFLATTTTSILSFVHERVTTRRRHPSKWIARLLLCKGYDTSLRLRTSSIQAGVETSSPTAKLLKKIANAARDKLSAIRSEAQWTRIFDRFDIFAMIVYQTINIVMFIVVLCI
ncbi:hypothetical protein PENTCL1PPCAC_30012, partial [Pristionchus entomophagus]